MKRRILSLFLVLAMLLALPAGMGMVQANSTVYYVDSVSGSDSNNGTSLSTPWQTLANINATTFQPGDRILLKCGGVWNGQLYPKGSGTSALPITISSYGTGSRPVVNGGSLAQGAAVYLYNQSYWVIENLEVTNDSGIDNSGTATTAGVPRYGILAENDSLQSGITIRNNFVHNVNGAFNLVGIMDAHINGGISVRAAGYNGKWNNILIQNNTVQNVGRTGIVAWQDRYFFLSQTSPDRAYMGTGLIVRNNTVSNLDSDGILVRGFVGSLIEYNVCQSAGLKMIPGFDMNSCAGIWPLASADTVIQYNEVFDTRCNGIDGQGFDVDLGNDNTTVQYNYSHDNQGGFILLMGGYNSNVKVRYNISQNEGNQKGIFTFSWGTPVNTEIYNNTIYIGANSGAVRPIYTDGDASTNNFTFKNNIIYNLGTGDYELPTVNGVKYGTFSHNVFYGNHPANEPADANKLTSDPMFENPGSAGTGITSVDGYKLQAGSPALSSGTLIANNGGKDYWGNLVSAGAVPGRGAYNGTGTGATETTVVDTLNNWSYSYSHTSNMMFDSTNPSYFIGDTSRAKRSNSSTGNIIYNFSNIKTFQAAAYKFSTTDLSKVKFYSSPDNVTWTLVSSTYTTPVLTANGWYSTTFTPASNLPSGTNYLKVELTDSNAWATQIGQVNITCSN